jgi:hypothetical protein
VRECERHAQRWVESCPSQQDRDLGNRCVPSLMLLLVCLGPRYRVMVRVRAFPPPSRSCSHARHLSLGLWPRPIGPSAGLSSELNEGPLLLQAGNTTQGSATQRAVCKVHTRAGARYLPAARRRAPRITPAAASRMRSAYRSSRSARTCTHVLVQRGGFSLLLFRTAPGIALSFPSPVPVPVCL